MLIAAQMRVLPIPLLEGPVDTLLLGPQPQRGKAYALACGARGLGLAGFPTTPVLARAEFDPRMFRDEKTSVPSEGTSRPAELTPANQILATEIAGMQGSSSPRRIAMRSSNGLQRSPVGTVKLA